MYYCITCKKAVLIKVAASSICGDIKQNLQLKHCLVKIGCIPLHKSRTNHNLPMIYLSAFEALHKIISSDELYKLFEVFDNILKNEDIESSRITEIILDFGKGIEPVLNLILEDPEIN